MAGDDLISFGWPERGSEPRPDADEPVELLFETEYPQLISAAFALMHDRDSAEQFAQQAFLHMWRRRHWNSLITDPRAARQELQDELASLARELVRLAPSAGTDEPDIDIGRAWRGARQRSHRDPLL